MKRPYENSNLKPGYKGYLRRVRMGWYEINNPLGQENDVSSRLKWYFRYCVIESK